MSGKIKSSDVYRLARHYRFQWEEAQGGYVLLFPEGMVKLNSSAGEVLKRVDGKRTVGEIGAELQALHPDVPNIQSDVDAMLLLALEKSWITLEEQKE